MTPHTIEPAQQTAARLAGFLYLLTNATAMFAFYARGQVMVRGDAAQTARNLAASERLFRVAIVTELLTVACVIILVMALYVVLKPINRNVAILAASWRLTENFILAVITLAEFAALALLSNADSLRAFDPKQLQALWYTLFRVYGAGFNIGFVFLGLGSTVFSYLWLKSRYIPRALAAWGIFSSLLLAVVTLAIIVFPSLAALLKLAYMAPMGIYEIGLGLWLLFKGIQTSVAG
jgi:hypothetical protein